MKLRCRFWVETAVTSITGVLCAITLVWPAWIETVSGWDPDHHNGFVEWAIAGGLFIATLTMFAVAAMEWHRTPVAELS